VKPSEITQVRDESFPAQLRRGALWTVLLLSLWLIPLLAVMLATIVERRMPSVFGPGPLVSSVIDLVKNGTRSHPQPWWTQLPDPTHSPTSPITLFVGFCGAVVLYTGLVTWGWQKMMVKTGQRERDQRRRRQIDGAQEAQAHEVRHLAVQPKDLGSRVVLGTFRTPRFPGQLAAVEAGHSVMVVAPPGKGKTESVLGPAILDWDGPVVVASMKRDIYDLTAGYRGTLGETRVLDPAGLTSPLKARNAYWTPIPGATTWRGAKVLADQMCGVGMKGAQSSGADRYFESMSGALLAGLLFAAAHSTVPTMQTVQDWLGSPKEAITELEKLLGRVALDANLDEEIRFNAPHAFFSIQQGMVSDDPRAVATVMKTVGNTIAAWNDYRFAHLQPQDPGVLSPEWLWEEPSGWEQDGDQRTLYLIGPESEQASYRAMFVGCITQIYNAYARAGQEGRRPEKRLLIVLDEVANMTPIPGLDTWVTTARGLGINLVFATQNLGQLDTVWGRDKAETIASGPRVAMFGPGIKDEQTLRYVEELSGETAVLTENVARSPYGFQIQTSRSTNTQWRPLIQRSEVREIAPFTGLVFSGETPPFRVNWRSAHDDETLELKQSLEAVTPSTAEREYLMTPRDQRPLTVPDGLTLSAATAGEPNEPTEDPDNDIDD
jgi:type IV secretion system protein VirD4